MRSGNPVVHVQYIYIETTYYMESILDVWPGLGAPGLCAVCLSSTLVFAYVLAWDFAWLVKRKLSNADQFASTKLYIYIYILYNIYILYIDIAFVCDAVLSQAKPGLAYI